MATEEQRYRALTFNIAGFALMTPLGNVVLNLFEILEKIGTCGLVFYTVFCSLLFMLGLTFIEFGRNILDGRRKFK